RSRGGHRAARPSGRRTDGQPRQPAGGCHPGFAARAGRSTRTHARDGNARRQPRGPRRSAPPFDGWVPRRARRFSRWACIPGGGVNLSTFTVRHLQQRPVRALLALAGMTLALALVVATPLATQTVRSAYRDLFAGSTSEAVLEITSFGQA